MTLYRNILLSSIPVFIYAYYRYRTKKIDYIDFFKNKNIIITGASQGIGRELALKLSKYDLKLFLLARSFKTHSDKNIYYYKCDCSKFDDVSLMMKSIFKISKNQNILIHCAGGGDWKFITEMQPKEIIDCIKAPLLSSIFTTREYLNSMDIQNRGENTSNYQVLFIQSPASIQPWKSSTAYSTSRIGMHGFTEALRADYHNKNVVFKEIILGKVDSTYFTNNPNANKRFPFLSNLIPEMSVTNAADIIIDALRSDSEICIYPPIISVLKFTHQVFPSLIKNLIYKLGYK